MTNDIREKAEALINWINEEYPITSAYKTNMVNSKEYKDLKAALRPSREEIADNIQTIKNMYFGKEQNIEAKKWLELAIEELRK